MSWYNTILHSVRKEFNLTHLEYCVIEMIDKLASHRAYSKEGWCYASAQYIADVQHVNVKSVKRAITKAVNLGLIEAKPRAGTSSLKRCSLKWHNALYTCQNEIKQGRDNITPQQGQNVPTTRDKMSPNNNTSNKKDNNNTVHSQKNELFKTSSKYHFDNLWERYAHKVNKQAAYKAYKRLSKKKIMEAVDGLARYEAILEVTKVSKCHLSTYLNGKRWLDEMPTNLPQSSNFNTKGKSEEQLKAHITSESFKKHPRFKDLYKKVQSVVPVHLRADKAKIDSQCLRFLDKFRVGVEEGVNRFDELINKNK